jgi:glycosyltransferase involved in cell wall biosynthesis
MHNAGAEWMQHSIMKWLVEQGHECRVLVPDGDYMFDGVKVMTDTFQNCSDSWRWCDVGFTHLVRAGKAWNWAQETRKPIIYTMHNSFTNRLVEVKNDFNLVYNTDWVRQDSELKGYKHKNMVLHPPVWFDDYHTKTSKKYITLINCWERKGGKMLIELAKALPEYNFAGVMGGYGDQEREEVSNLQYFANTSQIKRIYGMTRILLMPSFYESYGRTAVEAMCSGIPVVATETPGLVEALGDCGTFVADYSYVQGFINAIRSLDDKSHYENISKLSIERAKSFDKRNVKELSLLVEFMKSL